MKDSQYIAAESFRGREGGAQIKKLNFVYGHENMNYIYTIYAVLTCILRAVATVHIVNSVD